MGRRPRWRSSTWRSQPAEVLALLGPNGAGKTTTVEMCEGFIRPDGGTIEILGLDPAGTTPGCASASG